MPQFDLLSFMTQSFWILFSFNLFFDLLDSFFLPLIFHTLKIRQNRTKLYIKKLNTPKYINFLTEAYLTFVKNTYISYFK